MNKIPKKIKVYFRKRKRVKEVENLRQLYDRGYYHGDAYDDYSFGELGADFIEKTRFVRRYCSEGSRVLDVGCALGLFVKCALNEQLDAYGIDFSEYAVRQASALVGDRVKCADVEVEIPFENGFFDVVTAWDVLEHLRNQSLFLQRVGKVLKRNGLIFITTLNYNSLMSRVMKDRWAFIAPGYHQTHTITVANLRNWLSNAGLQETSISTFGFSLASFRNKIDLPVLKQIAGGAESVLRSELQVLSRLLRPFNLGDTILCVAKRVH